MAIDWDDNKKRKAFRESLQEVYPSSAYLEMFVDEELNKNLATVAGGANLQLTAYELVKQAKAKGWLDDVYQAFKKQNPAHPVIEKLEQPSIVSPAFSLPQADWDTLFSCFLPEDLPDLRRAFLQAFKQAKGFTFKQAQPNHPPFIELVQIRELLEIYDAEMYDASDRKPKPVLAIRFVEWAIAELQRSSQETSRDLTSLEQWRDRIAQQYNISLTSPEPMKSLGRQGYLLVALKESGRQTQKEGAFVKVFAELHVTGEPKPIEFEAAAVTCPFKEVAEHLSELIRRAEEALIPYECGEVTLELFLPCIHLEENVAVWEVKNEQNRPRPLGLHRRFLVRSLERALNRTIQATLKQNWQCLKTYVEAKTVWEQFHCQEDCPDPGILKVLLSNKPGLWFLAELPNDREQRLDILYDIINAAVPIALWSVQLEQFTAIELRMQFDTLLRASQITNFADLAQNWRSQRAKSEHKVIENMRLLCDCPDRCPSLPDPNREDDLLVAV